MTSNYAESFNKRIKDARTFPICSMVECIRFTLQEWFFKRREKSGNAKTKLSPKFDEDLRLQVQKGRHLQYSGVTQHEFLVLDGDEDGTVNMLTKECTCGLFQLLGLPCMHATCVATKRNIDVYSLCHPFYRVESWRAAYMDAVYPCGPEHEWNAPEELLNMEVKVPVAKNPVGRPKKKSNEGRRKIKHLPSQGEVIVVQRKCSICRGRGHNRKSCTFRQ